MSWSQGKKLHNDRYTIKKKLGEGGFGITYLAVENSKGTQVVIKTANDVVQRRQDFDKFQDYFLQEAKLLQKCEHPNIVQFYEVFQEEGLWCIVMEYIPGKNLAQLVIEQGVLSENEALGYIRQIGDALRIAHSHGILHRDVKPENIIKRNDKPEVVLIDFGIAREFAFNQSGSHTEFLSDGFAPLEQYYRRQPRGDYTDVYALAATLYVLLTGYVQKGILCHQLPKSIDRDNDIQENRPDPLLPPNKINPQIGDTVNKAILKGMKIKAKNRPQTVGEWLALLQPDPSLSQVPTQFIPGIGTLSKIFNNNVYQLELNTSLRSGLTWGAFFVFVVGMYVFAPSFNQPDRPSQPPEAPQSPSEPSRIETGTPAELPIPDVDYTALQNYLASGSFKEADEETLRIMLWLARREKKGWLDVDNINEFFCEHLRKIDDLWVQYSQGRFGFSIQKQVWIDVGGKSGIYNVEIVDRFADRVGWRVNDKFYDNMTYNLSAPLGHLPQAITTRGIKIGVPYLAEKLETCNVP